jgi:ABC-type Fe3+/spermidine/putrescine transport system ATPase subunit
VAVEQRPGRVAGPILELLSLSKRFGPTIAANRLTLAVERGEFFTFLGPNGSGKSTILRMVAGLEHPDAAEARIDGRPVAAVPPRRRELGMMFQQYAIFPHMTVAENIGYGLKVRGLSRQEIGRRVEQMLVLVGLSGMGTKSATLLSGGEQQRVALARALAPQHRMLLLDEPLAALDEKVRRGMQDELKAIHHKTGTTFLYVTHDQEEALTMSDRIAVFNRGICVQCDVPERLYRRPRTRFVATFFRGCNVLSAVCDGVAGGEMCVRLAGTVLLLPARTQAGAGTAVNLAVRAENVRLDIAADAPGLRLSARLTETVFRGTVFKHVLVLPDGQHLSATATRRAPIAEGSDVAAVIDPSDLLVLED